MRMYREISPQKIIEKRGRRTRREVLKKINFVITEQELYAYENSVYKPGRKKLPYLLKALDCTFDEISEPVQLAAV